VRGDIARPCIAAVMVAVQMPARLASSEFVNPFETAGSVNHWIVDIASSAGRLIHAGPGSRGGFGAWRTKRSGWAA
jgi:hypothetical protein